MRHPLRAKNLRLRLLPWYVLAGLVIWKSAPTATGLVLGGILVGAGAALRLWAAGHLLKTRELARSGPYAWVRHPLYLGALLMGLGFALASGLWAGLLLLAVGLPLFVLYYLPYKDRIEGARLERRHGARYRAYRERVPALLPSGRRARGDTATGWSARRVWNNDELGTLVGALLGMSVLVLRASAVP